MDTQKINFYDTIKTTKSINPYKHVHGFDVPFRGLIAAPSGSGKTHMLCNLIYHMDKTFHEIIICVLSSDEPLYQMMADRLGESVQFHEMGGVPSLDDYSMIDPKTKKTKRKDKLQRLIIFDDLIMHKKANQEARKYYIKGRKLGFSMMYLGQSFFQIPKMIRDNSQYFILGKNLLKKDLRMILSAFPTNRDLSEFTRIYEELTSETLDAIVIDINKRSIRKNIIGDVIKL